MVGSKKFGKRNQPQPKQVAKVETKTTEPATSREPLGSSERHNGNFSSFGATLTTCFLVIAALVSATILSQNLFARNTKTSAISPSQHGVKQNASAKLKQNIAVELDKAAAQLRAKTPMVIDGHTTLIDAKSKGTTLTYTYRIGMPKGIINRSLSDGAFASALQKDTKGKVCAKKDMLQSMKWGAAYTYIYLDTNHEFMGQFTLTDRDCA